MRAAAGEIQRLVTLDPVIVRDGGVEADVRIADGHHHAWRRRDDLGAGGSLDHHQLAGDGGVEERGEIGCVISWRESKFRVALHGAGYGERKQDVEADELRAGIVDGGDGGAKERRQKSLGRSLNVS